MAHKIFPDCIWKSPVCYEYTERILIIIVLLGTINSFQIHLCWKKKRQLQGISLLNKHRCCLVLAGGLSTEESFFGSSQEERRREEDQQGQL